MASDNIADAIREHLQCAICFEDMKSPRCLPCAHAFCLHCLEQLESIHTGQMLPCPNCRKEVELGVNGVRELPPHVLAIKILDELRSNGDNVIESSTNSQSVPTKDTHDTTVTRCSQPPSPSPLRPSCSSSSSFTPPLLPPHISSSSFAPLLPPRDDSSYLAPPMLPPRGNTSSVSPPVLPPRDSSSSSFPPLRPPRGSSSPPLRPPRGSSSSSSFPRRCLPTPPSFLSTFAPPPHSPLRSCNSLDTNHPPCLPLGSSPPSPPSRSQSLRLFAVNRRTAFNRTSVKKS